jgi:hypothetical protein
MQNSLNITKDCKWLYFIKYNAILKPILKKVATKKLNEQKTTPYFAIIRYCLGR